jgi:hypothetical protein
VPWHIAAYLQLAVASFHLMEINNLGFMINNLPTDIAEIVIHFCVMATEEDLHLFFS